MRCSEACWPATARKTKAEQKSPARSRAGGACSVFRAVGRGVLMLGGGFVGEGRNLLRGTLGLLRLVSVLLFIREPVGWEPVGFLGLGHAPVSFRFFGEAI